MTVIRSACLHVWVQGNLMRNNTARGRSKGPVIFTAQLPAECYALPFVSLRVQELTLIPSWQPP